MPGRWRRGTVHHVLVCGLAILVVSVLAACAGPGGEGIATIGAAATANDRLTTPGGTASATGSAAAATGTIAGRTVAAASSAGAAAMATAVRSPVAAGSMTAASAGSATTGARPATGGSASPGAASSATRPTTGSVTAGSATAGSAATRPTMTTASTVVIPPPPNGMEYVKGTNPIIDTILMAAEQGLSSTSNSVTVTSSKDYVSTATAMDVGAFYRMQMPMLDWKSEQDQNAASGITSLVFSRDNQTNAALILIVDLAQVNQKGCLVITATAKPK